MNVDCVTNLEAGGVGEEPPDWSLELELDARLAGALFDACFLGLVMLMCLGTLSRAGGSSCAADSASGAAGAAGVVGGVVCICSSRGAGVTSIGVAT